ncbi:MFS general substrate transporter [Thozetella sp. PMI_491]|nr:MFS general substrate transporter [Thozetella sp. PMI_491]
MAVSTDLEPGDVPTASESNSEAPDTSSKPEQGSRATWDGDNDPENPLNWKQSRKTVNISIIATLTLLSPLASSTIAPGAPSLARDFHITSKPVIALVVSIYVLGFAFGPLILAPLSELYGRRIIYLISNAVVLGFTIGCALAPNMASFIVFRFFSGAFGAAALSLCGGSVADIIPVEKRGAVMSIMLSGSFLGPVIGPIIGGYLAQGPGWRWVFWIQTILTGLVSLATFFFLRESHAPTLLRRKARKLDGLQQSPPGGRKTSAAEARAVLLRSITRPMKMLVRSPIVACLSLYLAIIYGYLYLLFTTFATVFPREYGFSVGIAGVSYLGIGVGCAIGLISLSWFSDWVHVRLTKKNGEAKPEYRLIPLIVGIPFLPIGLFVYGWTVQYKVHWIVPIIFTSFTGIGLLYAYLPTQIYMIDAYTKYAASALAAAGVVRSVFGACLPLAGESMYNALGYGWGNSLLGFLAIAASIAPFLFWRYGEKLRTGRFAVSFD